MADESANSPVQFTCTHCERSLSAKPDQAGQEIACPGCRAVLMVPAQSANRQAPVVETASVSAPEMRDGQVGAADLVQPATAPAMRASEHTGEQEMRSVSASAQAVVDAPTSVPRASGSKTRMPKRAGQSSYKNKATRYAPPPKRSGTRTAVIGVAVVIAVVVIGFLVFAINRHMEHAQRVRDIDARVRHAVSGLDKGEFEKATKYAKSARKQIAAHEDTFEKAKISGWRKRLEKIDDFAKRLDEIDELMKGASKDPTKTGNTLQRKRALMDSGKLRERPLLRKIDEALVEVARLEREAFLAALRDELGKAEAVYAKGEIEAAAEQARQVQTRLAAKRKVKDAAVKKRVENLLENNKRYRDARAAHAMANSDFTIAKKKLQGLMAPLKAENPNDKPLRDKVASLIKDVLEQEKRSLKLTTKELQKLAKLANGLAGSDAGIMIGKKTIHRGIAMTYDKWKVHLGYAEGSKKLVMVSAGHRFLVSERGLRNKPGLAIRVIGTLGDAMSKAGVAQGAAWTVVLDAPYPGAKREKESKTEFFYEGVLHHGKQTVDAKRIIEAKGALTRTCKDLTDAVMQDKGTPEDVKRVVVKLIEGAHKKLGWHDHLPRAFCRRALQDGYIERNLPEAAKRLKEPLDAFRKANEALMKLEPELTATNAAGDELTLKKNGENHHVIRRYDKKKDATSFGIKHPVKEKPLLHIVYEFPGKHADWPKDAKPTTIHMTHPSVGVISTFSTEKDGMTFDRAKWATAASLTTRGRRLPWRGTPQWEFPPHVLLVDLKGNITGLVTPTGKVGMPRFSAIKDLAKRREAQNKYLDELAKALSTTGHLHLYFLYFHQYVLDSPIVTATGLLGSRAHCGDIHQTVFESLERDLGGRYVGDCDDLAELYMNITRRQGKLSFVMAVPGHATCGWVEKCGDAYKMQFLDTGPPRTFQGNDIEKLVETGSRSYDEKKTMRFDPKSLGFLFRFAGEPTRTPYYLSTRMFVDRAYAETMERVQGYWHFHFYWLGVHTMEEMIAKGDRVPENCTELAGLYGRIHEFKKAIFWTKEAMKQLGPRDTLTRINETFRIGLDYRQAKDPKKAYEEIKGAVAELMKLYRSPDTLRYVSQRLSMANLLTSIDRPWEAWRLLRPDAVFFARRGAIRLDHAGNLTGIYEKMQELVREKGKKLTKEQATATDQLNKLLDWYYKNALFRRDDDFNDILRKYAFLGMYYGARDGREKLIAELTKPGPFPTKEKNHRNRSVGIEEDWNWIRLCPLSYAMQIGDALDPDDPPEKWRREEAVKLAEAMFAAAERAKKFGSLGSSESMLLTSKLTHGFLTKNWAEVEEVFKEVKRKNYARLTAQVAETLGQCARLVSVDVFVNQYRIFTGYIKKLRAPFFNVVYEAYRAEAYDHARRAAQVALKHWPNDENMKREAKFLNELIQNRIKEKASKKAVEKK